MDSTAVIGKRLKISRIALGVSAAELCRRIDIQPNRWSQYESGERPITRAVAEKLCKAFGLTLDWIYMGDPSALPAHLHKKLAPDAA